jgi:hypothetical protein
VAILSYNIWAGIFKMSEYNQYTEPSVPDSTEAGYDGLSAREALTAVVITGTLVAGAIAVKDTLGAERADASTPIVAEFNPGYYPSSNATFAEFLSSQQADPTPTPTPEATPTPTPTPEENNNGMTDQEQAYQCRNQALGNIGGLGYLVRHRYKGQKVHSRKLIEWSYFADDMEQQCKEGKFGKWAVSFYAAKFRTSDHNSKHPIRLGRTVTVNEHRMKGKDSYTKVQRLRKPVPSWGASDVVTTKWTDTAGLLGPKDKTYTDTQKNRDPSY